MALGRINHDQFRPVSSYETATNDALSARFANETTLSVNNALTNVYSQKLLSEIYPGTSCSGESYTDESVIRVWCPRYVPRVSTTGGSYSLYVVSGHVGPASDTTVWKLYSIDRLYNGDRSYETAFGDTPVASWTGSSTTHAIYQGSGDLVLDSSSQAWFVLTVTNTGSATGSYLTTLDVFARYFSLADIGI